MLKTLPQPCSMNTSEDLSLFKFLNVKYVMYVIKKQTSVIKRRGTVPLLLFGKLDMAGFPFNQKS